MPSREHGPGGLPEQPHHKEPEPVPYHRTARFAGEHPAGEAYVAVQRVIYEAPQPTDISAYRLQLNGLWHVAALGILPPAPVLQAIEDALAAGTPAELPPEVWQTLAERRAQQIRSGPWTQGHYRPGKRL